MFKQDTDENQLIDKVVHINRVAKVVKRSPVGGHAPPPDGASRVASDPHVHACRRQYPGGAAGCCRSSRPATTAFPISKPGRPPH